jgi:hypothetical protein
MGCDAILCGKSLSVSFEEMSVNFYQIPRSHILEDGTLYVLIRQQLNLCDRAKLTNIFRISTKTVSSSQKDDDHDHDKDKNDNNNTSIIIISSSSSNNNNNKKTAIFYLQLKIIKVAFKPMIVCLEVQHAKT